MRAKICIITTGGTIDGTDSDMGTIRMVSEAVKWLQVQPNIEVKHIALMNKDSRLINSKDREILIDVVLQETTDLIIVTHGTFTICETGKKLKQAMPSPSKTVLLVGAWLPFGESSSDAEDHMAFAVEVLKNPPKGVFVAMDGQLWNPDTTEKREKASGQYRMETSHDNMPPC